jgi:hypothetical protein
MFIYKNLTPHVIVVRSRGGVDTTLPPTGLLPRVEEVQGVELFEAEELGVRLFTAPKKGAVVGLPAPEAGVILIVSGMVREALPPGSRFDVFSPGTGPLDEAVREKGQVKAVTRLLQN